jgi:hypothetical protein
MGGGRGDERVSGYQDIRVSGYQDIRVSGSRTSGEQNIRELVD